MSTLSTTNIISPNNTTDLVVKTGNTTGPRIVVSANGSGVTLGGNSIANSVFINSTAVYVNGAAPTSDIATLTVTGGNNYISGNVTPSLITANTSAWNPGTSNIYVIRMQANNNNNQEYWISGLTAAVNGQIIILSNIGPTKITLRNEDSANETTAGNRFNLGNHVNLQGFGSVKLIYDGTLARWRPMNSALIAFDHKYSLTKGFFSGGSTPLTQVTTAERTTYSSETTAAVSGANLSQARAILTAAGNADKGFFSGGQGISPITFVATADRTNYSSETTAAVAGANLSLARQQLAGIGNADKGFFEGGAAAPGVVATADRTIFSSETTAAVAGANLSGVRQFLAAAGNANKGFFSGGQTPTTVATADRTTYSSETTAAVSGANLSQARYGLAAAGNADKGFFSGGFGVAPLTSVATADRTTYSSETTAAIAGANLSQARYYIAGAGNDVKGFFSGGTPVVATADRTTYSTETNAAVVGANLTQARYGLAAV